MDKISSILSGSPRVKSVDMSEATPVRPGAPAYGRPEGRNSIKDRVTLSERAKEMALKDTLALKDPKESARAKMVDKVSANFFNTRLKPVAEEVIEDTSSEVASDKAVNLAPAQVIEVAEAETK